MVLSLRSRLQEPGAVCVLVDMRVDDRNEPRVIEVNCEPGVASEAEVCPGGGQDWAQPRGDSRPDRQR